MSARRPASTAAEILYSGPPDGLRNVRESKTRRYLFAEARHGHARRERGGWLRMAGVTRNNLKSLDVAFPLGMLTAVTGVSGSGKSSLVSQALVELVGRRTSGTLAADETRPTTSSGRSRADRRPDHRGLGGDQAAGPGGPEADRTHAAIEPCDLHRTVRPRPPAVRGDTRRRGPGVTTRAGSPSTSRKGRCETCEGEGFVMVELLFLPSVYAPCPTAMERATTRRRWKYSIAASNRRRPGDDGRRGVASCRRAARQPCARGRCRRSASGICARTARDRAVGRRGAADQARDRTAAQQRGNTLYVLDEPTTGLHPEDVERLVANSRLWSRPGHGRHRRGQPGVVAASD